MNETKFTLNVRGRLVDLSTPQVMGILNVTPDSFYTSSRAQTETAIIDRAERIIAEGGFAIDIGAVSTRPGASPVSEADEQERLKAALTLIRHNLPDVVISVDTYRPAIARRCIEDWGADMINDVSEGGRTRISNEPFPNQERMFDVVGKLHVPYILMSVQSALRDMLLSFAEEVQQLRDLGVHDILLDPGYGFGKTTADNYRIFREAEKLEVLQLPILVGVSRKSMITQVIGGAPETSLNGTTVLHTIALMKGASVLRVHDVKEAVEAVKIVEETKPVI